jgi:hypothetical protein
MGAERLAALCKDLEAHARADATHDLNPLVEEVLGELQLVREALAASSFGAGED